MFSHCDLLEDKIRTRPTIKEHFDDFDGDTKSVDDVTTFLERKFLELVYKEEVKSRIKIVYTGMTKDATLIGQRVCAAVKELKMMGVRGRRHVGTST